MAIKDLFKGDYKILSATSASGSVEKGDISSVKYIKEYQENKERFIPVIDFSEPEKFVFYGSAEQYYTDAFNLIQNRFPYDDTYAAREDWYGQLSHFERYVFEAKYPRTNGFICLGNTYAATDTKSTKGFVSSSVPEYIYIKGGPNNDPDNFSLRKMFPSNNGKANLYRESGAKKWSNLAFELSGSEGGATIEFWMKKSGFTASNTTEAVFDLWNNAASGSSEYGRCTLYLDSENEQSVYLHLQSGSAYSDVALDSGLTSLADDNWHHYAVSMKNHPTDGFLEIDFYRDGKNISKNKTQILGPGNPKGFNEVSGGLNATIGALITGFGSEAFQTVGSTATITFTDKPLETKTLTLVDTAGVSKTFEIDNENNGVSGTNIALNGIAAGGGGATGTAADLTAKINAESGLGITAANPSAGVVSVTQDTIGVAGNTTITENMDNCTVSNSSKFVVATVLSAKGYGKLSGSLDEFRYWKTNRTDRDIGRYWFTQVEGGSNTNTLTSSLGVYYKFNEGITGIQATDATVLDYSGRVSNGDWVGYVSDTSLRQTGSAMVLSDATKEEYKDPILYAAHPEVSSIYDKLIEEAKYHDDTNNSGIYHSIPEWITTEDRDSEQEVLKKLTQIIAGYFDELQHLTAELPRLKEKSYRYLRSLPSGSGKPLPFANSLLDSSGFISPEIFVDADVLAQFMHRDEDRTFSDRLHNIKNAIYQNIYNNLVHIYKSKGTEKSFRNLFRCFGIDEELLKINLYADDVTYEYKDNYKPSSVKKTYVDFNHADRHGSIVYQQTSSANTNTVSYIDGFTGGQVGTPMTFEAEVIFPYKFTDGSEHYIHYDHLTSSIFGVHTALNNQADLSWDGPDYNFTLLAVRDEKNSPHVRFAVSSSLTSSVLFSDTYYDVYDSHRWNFAVRVKPDEFPLGTHGQGTTDQGYTLEMYGVRVAADVVQEEFSVGSPVTNALGSSFLKSKKRLFVGSDRVDTTGSQKFYSDVKVSSVAAWTSYLSSSVIQAHAFDPGNMGIDDPYKNAFLMNVEGTPVTDAEFVPRSKTLALHWDFSTVTGSGAANSSGYGDFFVEDLSSGSAKSRFGEFSHILEKQHTGLGDRFLVNQKEVVDTEFLSAAEKRLPEVLNSSDMVSILEQDDIQFTRDSRPINVLMMIEKSMYQTVSEDMINMFASVKDFNNLVGEPVNQYRSSYKDLEKLRSLYFDSIGSDPDLEKYLEYYKWIDSAISKMAEKLIPASANMPDTIKTVIEEYVLGKGSGKVARKFPTMEFKTSVPEASLRGIDELTYNWKYGHAPLPSPVPPVAATATITITDFTELNAGDKVNLIATDGTNYNFVQGDQSSVNGTFEATTSNDQTATNLMNVINTSSGPAGRRFTATVDGAVVTVTQATSGVAGNTSVTLTDSGTAGMTKTDFTGGEDRPISQNENSLWWKERSDKDRENGRDKINSIATTDVSGSWIPYKLAADLARSSSFSGSYSPTIYHGSTYARRALLKPYKLNVTKNKYLHGGHNFHENKRIGISQTAFLDVDATRPIKLILNPFASGSTITTDVFDPTAKLRRDAMVVGSSAGSGKSNHLMPFSLHSSSVDMGDFNGVEGEHIEITNLHHDGYGVQGDVPMQGPFTETHVGGRQHRHIIMGTGSDNARNRPEGFRVNFNTTSTEHGISHADIIGGYDKLNPQSPAAPFMRDEYAKRPINVRNIKTGEPEHAQRLGDSAAQLTKVDAQLRIGNYRKKYEIFQTSGRTKNNSVFKNRTAVFDNIFKTRTNGGVVYGLPESGIISGTVDFERLQRTGTFSNKHVFVERFSSPGGPATMGDSHGGPGLDIIAGEYSVYNTMNYRNKLVRDGLNRFEKAHSVFGGLELPRSGSTNLLYPSMDRGKQKNKFRAAVGKLNFGIRRNYPGGTGDGGLISHASFLSGSKFGIYDGSKYASFVIDSGSLTGSNGEFINFTIRDCNPAPFTLIQLGGQVTTGSTGIGQVVNADNNGGPHQAWIARVVADAIKETFGENMDVSVEDRTITMRTIMDSSYHDSRPQFHDVVIHEQPGDPGDFQLQHTGDDDPGDGRGFWFTGSHPGRAQKNYYMAGGSDAPVEDSNYDRGLWHYFQIEDALDYPSNPSSTQDRISYHKSHRNTRKLLKTSQRDEFRSGTVGELHDNRFVRHMIPANDFQYAWITASHLPFDVTSLGSGRTQIPGGYAAPDGMYSSSAGEYPAISFVSASDFGSVMTDNFPGRGDETSIIRVFGGTHASMAQSGTTHGWGGTLGQRNNNWIPTDFVGLNTNLYEPITSSMNTLGYPKFEVGRRHDYMGKSSLLNHFFVSGSSQRVEWNPLGSASGSAKYDVFDNLVTFDRFRTGRNSLGGAAGTHPYETLIQATAISPAALVNALYLHRNGPYGYPSWKQVRGGEHAVVRYHKKKNIISIMKRPETKKFAALVSGSAGPTSLKKLYEVRAKRRSEFHNRVEPAVTSRYFPMQTSVEAADGGLTIEHTYGNNLVNYANPVLNNNSDIGDPEQQTYDKLKALYLGGVGAAENPITAFNYHIYKETVFPRERYTYLAKTRGRENYTETHVSYSSGRPTDHLTFWKDDELERVRITASSGPGTWSNPNDVPLGGQHEPFARTVFGRTLSVLSASSFPWMTPTSDISPAGDSILGFGGAGITPGRTHFTSSYWLPASIWDLDAAAPYAALVMPTGSRRVTGSHSTAIHKKYFSGGELVYLGAQSASDSALAKFTPAYGLATASHAPDWVGDVDNPGVTGSLALREPIQVVGSRKYPWWVTSSLGKYEALTALNGALCGEGRAIQEFYMASEADQLDTTLTPDGYYSFGNPWNVAQGAISQRAWHSTTFGKPHDSMKRQRLKAGLTYEFLQWVPNWINAEGIQPFNSQSVSGDLGTREYEHYIPRYRTNTLAGRNPWFNSYSDYLDDIRRMAKDHTILPEFRMSEHVDYYMDKRMKDPNKAWLKILGGRLNASSSAADETGDCNTAIFQEYSHSDFMKYFGEIQAEHTELVETRPSVLKLSMQGVKKLLPYKGFYPSQRTVQIAQIFSQSFSPGIDNEAGITALNQPFFGPGILLNSIKSGIACDWLTYTSSAPRVDKQWAATTGLSDKNPMIIPLRDSTRVQPIRNGETQPGRFQTSLNRYYSTSSLNDYYQWHSRHPDSGSAYMSLDLEPSIRLPFEALITPQKYMPKPSRQRSRRLTRQRSKAGLSYIPPMVPGLYFNNKYNQYPVTGNFDGKHDQRYEIAINNFLSETARFFLEEGTFTSFASAPEKDFDLLVSGTTYYMDVTLRKTKDMVMYEGPSSLGGWFPSVVHYANVDAFNSLGAPGIEVPQVYKYQGTANAPNAIADIFPWSGVGDECTGSHIMAEGPYMFMPGVNSAKGMHYGPSMRAFSASFLSDFRSGQFNEAGRANDLGWHTRGVEGGNIAARAWAVWMKNFTDPSFAPYTPPYFYGDSTARFRFSPHLHYPMSPKEAQKFSLDEILAGARKETLYINDNERAFNEPHLHFGYGAGWNDSGSYNITTVFHDYDGGNTSQTGSANINHWMSASSFQNEFNGVVSPEGDTDYEGTSLARKHQMKLDSSLNLFAKTREKKVTYDPVSGQPTELTDSEDTNLDVWSIHTKWECPVLNFSDNSTTTNFWSNGAPTVENNFNRDLVGTATRGMWKGYGTSPAESEGIFLEIKESFPTVVEDNNLPKIGGDRTQSSTSTGVTGSLMQALGFSSEQKKIGRVRDSKIISEAVVAVPFYRDETDAIRFFHLGENNMISRALYNVAAGNSDADLNPGDSIIDMAERMKKYIIPPHLDFSSNMDIQPFAMYIFPFTHELSRKDLENIWQGIMPDISVTAEKQEISLAHNLDENEFFRGQAIPAATRWMVFKVKQRAEKSYRRVIRDTKDDPRYEFKFKLGTGLGREATYNWPYDYFSLVELGRLDASVRIGGEPLVMVERGTEIAIPDAIPEPSDILMKVRELESKVEIMSKTSEPNVEKVFSKFIKKQGNPKPKELPAKAFVKPMAESQKSVSVAPKIRPEAKKALPKGMMTKEEKVDYFNKGTPEKSPLYKKTAASKEVTTIGAGFATKREQIVAAKIDPKVTGIEVASPNDIDLKF